jgi:hypothetical protein
VLCHWLAGRRCRTPSHHGCLGSLPSLCGVSICGNVMRGVIVCSHAARRHALPFPSARYPSAGVNGCFHSNRRSLTSDCRSVPYGFLFVGLRGGLQRRGSVFCRCGAETWLHPSPRRACGSLWLRMSLHGDGMTRRNRAKSELGGRGTQGQARGENWRSQGRAAAPVPKWRGWRWAFHHY